MIRSQKQAILKDLQKKMVLIAGPRQAGKTWLAKDILKNFDHAVYLNYDHTSDRAIMLDEAWLPETNLLVLDEIHKMPKWKNYLKGIYDTKPAHLKILVTGSARLDVFHQAGDSLAGRYYLHHLLPLSPAELKQTGQSIEVNQMINQGTFPEPYLETSIMQADRWRQQYINSLLREDVVNFDHIRDLKAIQLVFELLRTRVGSPVSYLSIAEDVQISPHTVKRYIEILEALYIIFKITPYSKNIARSLIKEPKIYFFDSGLVKGDKGIVFENFVATCLLKHMYAKRDYEGKDYGLFYLRDKEQREVDFALVNGDQTEQLIEVKYRDGNVSSSLKYFHEKYHFPAVQIIKEVKHERISGKIQLLDALRFLTQLSL